MRKHIKEQLKDILNSLLQLHGELLEKNTYEIADSLQDCQQAAIVVGETLEKNGLKQNMLSTNQAVSLLEQYCEELYFVSQEEIAAKERVEKLNLLINQVIIILNAFTSTYQAVFFPYKAEMWDSLESIWLACKEDMNCEAVVVPIPYYRYDVKSKETVVCYDGDKFPKDVPVVSYIEYSLQNEMPDIAYVHNPYDDHNLVTSIHPAFYSSELKKYVKKLVYVPYYVTTGGIAKDHLLLPVYLHMDYMVAQSQFFKDGCKEMFYYGKVLPLGSPKLDKIIHLCNKEKEDLMPIEWKLCLEGKKTLMLNTSLNCFLQQGEQYLQKMYLLFQWVKEQNKVALVWRPHPLLEATIHSLRPQLLEKYKILKAYFESEKIGIFDDTPDMERTVAIVDGYIGEESTSVINLFGVVGKPQFILNNFIYTKPEENWNRRLRILDMVFRGGKWYMESSLCNGLFSVKSVGEEVSEIDWNQIQLEGRMEEQPKWNKISLFSGLNDEIKFIQEHEEFIGELRKGMKPEKYNFLPDISDYVQVGKYLYITASYTNRVLCVDRESLAYKVYEVGHSEYTYSAITGNGQIFWLAEAVTGRLLKWEVVENQVIEIEMPMELGRFTRFDGLHLVHKKIFDMGQWIVTVPAFSDCMVKVDKLTEKVSLCAKELWDKVGHPCNDYHPLFHESSSFAKKVDENILWIQRTSDDALIELKVDTEKYKIHYPTMTIQAMGKLLEGEDGFECPKKGRSAFARRESRWFFMEDFMNDLVLGQLEQVRERQLSELSEVAANLDGSCGKKVHQFMMDVLKTEE